MVAIDPLVLDSFVPDPLVIVATTVGFLLGVVLTGLILWFSFRRRFEKQRLGHEANELVLQNRVESRQLEIENQNHRVREIQERLSTKESLLQNALVSEAELKTMLSEQQKQNQEKLALLNQAREQLGLEFKNIANEIFESKQRTFKEQSQAHLDGVLKPLGEKIKDFEKRVEETYNRESRERFSLVREVRNLQDLNTRISKDAINLTNALKGDNKTQGTWGEIILERVLEKSGLVKGREYEIQVSLKNEEGKRLQPDVVVHLPEQKDVIIDSKVSLVAYERYCSSEDQDERAEALRQHIQSVRQHIKQLNNKDYQKLVGIRTLDFVLMFIPVEAAFAHAVQHDDDLFVDAFDKNIVLVAPSTLLATLRTIQNIWRYEQQNKNAQEIAGKAGALYDKFVNFVADLEDIGGRLGAVQAAYDKAHNKLISGKGNLVSRAESVRELGAKVSKTLPRNLVEMPRRDEALHLSN
ncbi:MAG: DNA recombination protein RmuC [bacterium]|nr:DNA recombination protein RmuC [Gammaproteobacteria bacterium]HIL98304.1 DNA recombination protein RmuC [Pseudomonadales bacterium]